MDVVEVVRRRLADGRTIADSNVHDLVAEVDRMRALLVAQEIEHQHRWASPAPTTRPAPPTAPSGDPGGSGGGVEG